MRKLFYMNIANPYFFSNFITNYAQFYVRIDASRKQGEIQNEKRKQKTGTGKTCTGTSETETAD